MKTFQHFETSTGKILLEHPITGKLLDFEGFWLLNDNIRCDNKNASPVAALSELIETTIRFISLYTNVELLKDTPEAQQSILADLYKVKDELIVMVNV
jgi:hypothetical protein